jgi:hypothetical protein
MIVYQDDHFAPPPDQRLRMHPYEGGASPGVRYHDFRARPDLIPEVLEDFIAMAHYPAVQTFYELLRWINGPTSVFESNDCGLRPVRERQSSGFSGKLECTGRLMIFLRELKQNVSRAHVESYMRRIEKVLREADPEFVDGAVALTLIPCGFEALSTEDEVQVGDELQITWWAFGDTEGDALAALERVYGNVSHALRKVSDELAERGRGS